MYRWRLFSKMSFLFFSPVLDHIKSSVSKQCTQNEEAAEKIRDLLTTYEDKLKDLDAALKDASDLVKKANAENGLNAQAMDDLQVTDKKFISQEECVTLLVNS